MANRTNFLLEMLVWQNGFNPKKKAEHNANKPKPFLPDFMKDTEKQSAINNGSEARPTHEIDQILGLPRAQIA